MASIFGLLARNDVISSAALSAGFNWPTNQALPLAVKRGITPRLLPESRPIMYLQFNMSKPLSRVSSLTSTSAMMSW